MSDTAARPTAETFTVRERTQSQLVLRRFLRHRAAVTSLVLFVVVALFAYVGPLLWKYSYTDITDDLSQPPSLGHPFGTDLIGHDTMAQVMRGTQQSLKIALAIALIGTVLGALWGAIAGLYRGKLDFLMMRIVDVVLTLPTIAVAAAVAAQGVGGSQWWSIAVILGALTWPYVSRVVRGVVLSLREQEFIEAARALGAGNARIILRHLLPNALGAIIVVATLTIATGILGEAALSFLGVGVQAPDTSLGLLVSINRDAVNTRPWLFYFPGLLIILIALTINFVGDGLRDAFDPKQTRVRQ
ncbi:ABC transporter permease [Paractinoplanes durhamensis]|uniref:ABC transporter permease n=1 Tax=Paractinoplanes durhamensis TaxID=113563 RepID=A0ABQ3ZB61_9ACTN|nr:ABC transporter permease [Actinoplanes durhamensis]GIE07062.1 ABC transporter permease [Actinoplanes durhamensis]